MKYNVDFFIKKFTKIPKEKWCTNKYDDGNGAHCALGHCTFIQRDHLSNLFANIHVAVTAVNDQSFYFKQKHPKTRILAALRKIKKVKKK